ncbi:uncharacterized protein LOC118281118 [Spodoptera frugiperda]|uniref:Uncharacterized protein LOC118281118 n=1 Tax=Spodoptera frugiperda TaxID=7108 RepID=A0A9R0F034_SPOFR|nr:uncharacterized protein LOC118281118 [Spodoptera frugiperda]
MEKPKVRKTKTMQITYPAPYLHSWNSEAPPLLKKCSPIRTRRLFHSPRRPISTPKIKSKSYSAVRGPDPTAPHLKYGVFSNKRIIANRATVLPKGKQPTPNSRHSNVLKDKLSDDLMSRHSMSPTMKCPVHRSRQLQPQIRESPVFVFRTIDKSFTRQLSLSKMMHYDIKPKKYNMSAPSSFCPLYNQRICQRAKSPVRKTVRQN